MKHKIDVQTIVVRLDFLKKITNNKKVSKKLLWGLGIVASIVVIYLIANKIKKRNQEKNSSSL